ncbi:MAG: ROK family protein [Mogibacterium sp.]|nr:ROK family protein [Mogibacterium sp.]
MAGKYNVCLDVGGTKILGVIFDENKEIVARIKKRTKEDFDDLSSAEKVLRIVVKEMMDDAGISKKDLNAISAGFPSVIDAENGIILSTANIPWNNVPIKAQMEKAFGVPFYAGNDVNLGVLGEHRYGAARGYDHVVGLFIGTGIGGGLILNGALYTGYLSKGAELGHIVLDTEGPLCPCGQRGCLEAFSSKKGIASYIREQAARGRESMMTPYVQTGVFKSKYLKKALKKNDPLTVEAIDRACYYLAAGTGTLINTFSPQVVVYGGGVMEACGDQLLEKILRHVDRFCMTSIRPTVELKVAELGDDSNVYGALAIIEDHQN